MGGRLMPFDMGRMKKFFGTMLMLALILTLAIIMLSFVAYVVGGGSPMGFIGTQTFIMGITFLILEWVGIMMIKGKFHPPTDMKTRQPQQTPMRQFQVPAKIPTDNCSFCRIEKPVTELRPFYDGYGNEILICEECIKKESK